MVVDDEDTVRTVIDEALTRVGFTVTGASSGLKAIEAFERESGRFDLVVLDLKIPAMDPAEVVRRLRAVRPDVKILLMSGYERQKAHESALSLQLSGFLPKPFTLEEMTSKVRSVLAS
jgi:CheY-like chemotaxis protein